jgi:hypothetical protein
MLRSIDGDRWLRASPPTFLALTGYEQVRSVVAELAGDHESAARVELGLPDTGVCGGSGLLLGIFPCK